MKGTRAHIRYKLDDGTPVPGVTTVTGLLNKPALVKWANKLGLDGVDVTRYVDKTAEAGTCCHLMIQHRLSGTSPDLTPFSADVQEKARIGLAKFEDWLLSSPITPIALEIPLVSRRFRFGGTIDCYGEAYHNRQAALTLIDFKTSSGIYPEMYYQVAAYRKLLEESGRDVDQVKILRIGREPGAGFEERRLTDYELRRSWKIFVLLLAVHRLTTKGG